MPTLSLTNFNSGDVLTAEALNANNDQIETLINTTKLDTSNLQQNKAMVAYPFYFASLDTATHTIRIRNNFVMHLTQLDFSIGSNSGSSSFELDLKYASDFSSIPSAASIISGGGPISRSSGYWSQTGFTQTEFPVGSYLILELERATGGTSTASDITIILTVKTLLQA